MAGLNIGKIKLGKEQEKRNLFDLSHDVTTTMDWGEVQPLMCREMVPGSEATVSVDSFVRLAPMPKPTFGRASMKQFHTFVPIVEVWHAFESFMSKKPYTNGQNIYVPTEVPSANQTSLTLEVLSDAKLTVYKKSGSTTNLTIATSAETNSAISLFKGLPIISGNYNITKLVWTTRQNSQNAITLKGADYVYEVSDSSNVYVLCFKLTSSGRRLRKIFLGLGYQMQLMNGSQLTKISLLPLFCWYKSYFDIFAPQRDITWTQTAAYKLIENIELGNYPDVKSFYISNDQTSYFQYWKDFINEVRQCWFTDSVDYYSAHVATPAIGESESMTTNSVGGLGTQSIGHSTNSQPQVNTLINQAQLNIMKKMYHWVNKNTLIGGRVAEYMRVHFGSDVLEDHKSNFIGNSNININISDVMSNSDTHTASNDGRRLGEYGGKGVGYGSSNDLHFQADVYGYWITLATVVPDSTFFQGLDPNLLHTTPQTFFTPTYDAVGYQVTPRACFVGDSSVESTLVGKDYDNHSSVGYIPRYTEYKVAQNVLNGDVSLRSTKNEMLPFTLDKYISDDEVTGIANTNADGGYSNYYLFPNRNTVPAASTEWRYIGKYGWLSNFNRIFYLNEENAVWDDYDYEEDRNRTDNFVVHNIVNVRMLAPMLQISDSFETESNDDSIAVQKA